MRSGRSCAQNVGSLVQDVLARSAKDTCAPLPSVFKALWLKPSGVGAGQLH